MSTFSKFDVGRYRSLSVIGGFLLIKKIQFVFVGTCLFMFFGSVSAKDLPDFTKLVDANAKAVVNISTIGKRQSARSFGRPRGDERLEEFFRFFGPPGSYRRSPNPQTRSLGSGFIISKDGYILTNNHVVENASQILVRFSDRSELEAELIGADPRSDLALLKVESASDLPTLEIGSSERLKVGEWVLAIGSPFGFDYSVTAGIVSAKGRSLPTEKNENYVPYIQTDVAINPGNSGGPLFNLEGEVIGINAQIYSNSGGFMGVSFAIPIDVAIEVSNQLKEDGRVARGWLGVMIQEVSKELAESFGLSRPQGALVAKVLEGSPASKYGVLEGDIIIEFNKKSIERSSELPHSVGRVVPGEKASLTIVRASDEMILDVVIEELPEAGEQRVLADNKSEADRLGLVVQELTPEQLNRIGIQGGVAVAEVEGEAALSGIRAGDVITRLNNLPVSDTASLDRIAAGLTAGRTYPILVIRNQTPTFLAFKVPG